MREAEEARGTFLTWATTSTVPPMRLLAEAVTVCAGATVIATYLGFNVKKWLQARRFYRERNEGRDNK